MFSTDFRNSFLLRPTHKNDCQDSLTRTAIFYTGYATTMTAQKDLFHFQLDAITQDCCSVTSPPSWLIWDSPLILSTIYNTYFPHNKALWWRKLMSSVKVCRLGIYSLLAGWLCTILRGSVIKILNKSLLLLQIIGMTWFCYCSFSFRSFLYFHFSSK